MFILAFVLEKMTKTMKQNWRFVKVCHEIWSEYDSLPKIVSYTLSQGNIFSLAKALSIEQVIKRRLQTLETRDLREARILEIQFYLKNQLERFLYYFFIEMFS